VEVVDGAELSLVELLELPWLLELVELLELELVFFLWMCGVLGAGGVHIFCSALLFDPVRLPHGSVPAWASCTASASVGDA
jgi:hypothetical protein